MRIYMNAEEAFEEVKRDLSEMGILVKPKSMQDKIIEGNSDYETMELQNYCYTILDVKSKDVPKVIQPWADEEFKERVTDPFKKYRELDGSINFNFLTKEKIDKLFINPGKAYKLREDVWNEYLHNGKLAYSYNELLWKNDQITKVINRIKEDSDSRQLWISLWNPEKDPDFLGGVSRVPCSLGYSLQVREGKLNLHYVMRSCDFSTHFANDVYLAIKFLEYVSEQTNYPVGNFTHTIFSLHVYKKDLKNVF